MVSIERLCRWFGGVLFVCVGMGMGMVAAATPAATEPAKAETPRQARLRGELAKLPFRIAYESFRGKDWEIMLMNADGTGGKNLTNSPASDATRSDFSR